MELARDIMAVASALTEFEQNLASGRIVFLVGSGIGNDSGIANVSDVVKETLVRIVGRVSSEDEAWVIDEVQPELLYSTVIECAGSDDCLNVWKCLDPVEWAQLGARVGYRPRPSAAHLFIAAYSYHTDVPVFTTNYDLLFEAACADLGIPCRTVARTPSASDLESGDGLLICKLHGSVGFHGERIGADMVVTTMDGISRINVPWLEYISGSLEGRNLCLVGYSGRDLDYYPELKERKLEGVCGDDWYWFVSEPLGRGLAYPQALSSGAKMIPGRPSTVMSETWPRLLDDWGLASAAQAVRAACSQGPAGGTAASKTDFISLVGEKYLSTVSVNRDLFWVLIRLRMGMLREAEAALGAFGDAGSLRRDALSAREEALLLSAETTIRREKADFLGYRESARRLLALSSREIRHGDASSREIRHGDASFAMMQWDARLQIVSSYYMEIPAHLCFPVPVLRRRYATLLLICVLYPVLVLGISRERARYDKFHPVSDGGLVGHNLLFGIEGEARVRWLAVKMGLAQRFPKRFAWHVVAQLEELHDASSRVGNYGTALGTAVYLDRLEPSGAWRKRVDWPSQILKEKSYRSRSLRDRGDYDGALEQAELSGNVLNAIKALMGKAWERGDCRAKAKRSEPLLDRDDLSKLDGYIDLVSPSKLVHTLRFIKDRYIA